MHVFFNRILRRLQEQKAAISLTLLNVEMNTKSNGFRILIYLKILTFILLLDKDNKLIVVFAAVSQDPTSLSYNDILKFNPQSYFRDIQI